MLVQCTCIYLSQCIQVPPALSSHLCNTLASPSFVIVPRHQFTFGFLNYSFLFDLRTLLGRWLVLFWVTPRPLLLAWTYRDLINHPLWMKLEIYLFFLLYLCSFVCVCVSLCWRLPSLGSNVCIFYHVVLELGFVVISVLWLFQFLYFWLSSGSKSLDVVLFFLLLIIGKGVLAVLFFYTLFYRTFIHVLYALPIVVCLGFPLFFLAFSALWFFSLWWSSTHLWFLS